MKTEPDQIGTDNTDYKIYAIYGKDSEGLFEVKFLVEEDIDDDI